MTIHLLSCLVTSFIASLKCTSKWVQTVVNRAADLSMQAAFEEVKALPHSSAQGEVSIHTWNIIYCCCTTFQYSFLLLYHFIVVGDHRWPTWFHFRCLLHNCAVPGWKVSKNVEFVWCIYVHHVFVCYTSNQKIVGIRTLSCRTRVWVYQGCVAPSP